MGFRNQLGSINALFILWKTLCEDRFLHFPRFGVFGSIRKKKKRVTENFPYLTRHEIDLFSANFFGKQLYLMPS